MIVSPSYLAKPGTSNPSARFFRDIPGTWGVPAQCWSKEEGGARQADCVDDLLVTCGFHSKIVNDGISTGFNPLNNGCCNQWGDLLKSVKLGSCLVAGPAFPFSEHLIFMLWTQFGRWNFIFLACDLEDEIPQDIYIFAGYPKALKTFKG